MKTAKTFLFFLLLLNCQIYANHPLIRNFSREIYKSGGQNWSISQDDSDIMYFGNNMGLLEFDGKAWATYPIHNHSTVRSVLCVNNRIYAGAFNEFGYYTRQPNGLLKYFPLSNQQYGDFCNVWNILSNENEIYFQAERVVFKYMQDSIIELPAEDKISTSAMINNTLFIATENKGSFLLKGDYFKPLPNSEILMNKIIKAILPFGKNQILFVSSFDGCFIFDGIQTLPFNTSIDNFLKTNQVFCAITNSKELVFGTVQKGIAILDLMTNNVIYCNTYSGLQNNTVLSMGFQKDNNLWLGLDKGIDYVMINEPIMNLFGANNLYGTGYASLLKDNVLYLGTNQGLYYSPYPLPHSPQPPQLAMIKGSEGQIWSLTNIDNTVFCGSDKGAFIVHPSGVEYIDETQGTWGFKQLKKHSNMILGSSYNGMYILKKRDNKWTFSHNIKGTGYESGKVFEEDEDGNIWMAQWLKGVYKIELNNDADSITAITLYNMEKGFPQNQNNTFSYINNQFIFSTEGGFYIYNKEKDEMEPDYTWNNMFKRFPYLVRTKPLKKDDIFFYSKYFIGYGTGNSQNSYYIDSISYRLTLPKLILGFEDFYQVDDKTVMLSNEDGFYVLDINIQGNKPGKLNISVRNRNFNNLDTLTEAKVKNGTILLPKKYNSLSFEFVAPEYRQEDAVLFACLLENYDDKWAKFSPKNVKEYTQLPKGKYTLKVKAYNILDCTEGEYSLNFEILPAWYESTLALIIYLLLITILFMSIFYYMISYSKKEVKKVEQKKTLELENQGRKFEADAEEKKEEIKRLKNQKLQYELRMKSQEIANSTMNLVRKNEILRDINVQLGKLGNDIKENMEKNILLNQLSNIEKSIEQNIENDNSWKKFEVNFDVVYDNFLKRLSDKHPTLTVSDKKLCAYLKMDLSSKDIAPLLNMTVRSVEMSRHRLRKKLDLSREVNLTEYLQTF